MFFRRQWWSLIGFYFVLRERWAEMVGWVGSCRSLLKMYQKNIVVSCPEKIGLLVEKAERQAYCFEEIDSCDAQSH